MHNVLFANSTKAHYYPVRLNYRGLTYCYFVGLIIISVMKIRFYTILSTICVEPIT